MNINPKSKKVLHAAAAVLFILLLPLVIHEAVDPQTEPSTQPSTQPINPFAPGGKAPIPEHVPYTDFLAAIEKAENPTVTVTENRVGAILGDRAVKATVPPDAPVTSDLRNAGATIRARRARAGEVSLGSILINFGPVLLIIAFILWIFRKQMNAAKGQGALGGLKKSNAKLLDENSRTTTFDRVAGAREAKRDLAEVVEFLNNPDKFTNLGGRVPHGVLLSGPPGTGKTLLARAAAGEAGVSFYTLSGSSFVEMLAGVGASRVRDLFAEAKKKAPCIVFIDEIDAIGRKRGSSGSSAHDEREQTLNQMLSEMDGFEDNDGIVVVGATNAPDLLDPALTRPGRFDRNVHVGAPDVAEREEILGIHLERIARDDDVDPSVLARGTPGFTGADLENLCNEAALGAAREDATSVTARHFREAADKIRMGPAKESSVMTEHQRRITARHEAGHAIVGMNVPGNDPLHKVTIVPRGRSLGQATWLPETDRTGFSRRECRARIAMAYGGRAGEELAFGGEEVTSGAASDIQQATAIARKMVREWGMGSVGPIDLAEREGFVPGIGGSPESDRTAEEIDKEVKQLLDEGIETARHVLREHEAEWDALSNALLERETLEADEIERIVSAERTDGESVNRNDVEPHCDHVSPRHVGKANGTDVPQGGAQAAARTDGTT